MTLDYVLQFPHTEYAPSTGLRSYKINFYLNFHILTVEIGQNRNEIDDIKITNNLGSEYYLYLKGYLKRKSPLKIVT